MATPNLSPSGLTRSTTTGWKTSRDCISRQLWWGHRIPAWYCDDCGELIVSREDPSCCPKCGGTHPPRTPTPWTPGSPLPWALLHPGLAGQNPEMEYFYPTNTLVTGYDIIFFWVARMIFSGLEHTGKTPLTPFLIHGIVRMPKAER